MGDQQTAAARALSQARRAPNTAAEIVDGLIAHLQEDYDLPAWSPATWRMHLAAFERWLEQTD